MPTTPTDPTKAQVWVTGTAPNQQFEFYIPRGAKGEPGGIVSGTLLTTQNLNTVTTPGVYRQDTTGNATAPNNYPAAATGILYVDDRLTGGQSVMQTYYPFMGANGGTNPRHFYKRYLVGASTWGPWETYAAQRVDQTAGRAIYTWDTLNQREQIIYGDTGWRNISADLVNGWTGDVRIRRFNGTVTVRMANLNGSAATNVVFYNMTAGFFDSSINAAIACPGANPLQFNTGGQLNFPTGQSAFFGSYGATVSWSTVSTWPITLPGTAIGGIPNL